MFPRAASAVVQLRDCPEENVHWLYVHTLKNNNFKLLFFCRMDAHEHANASYSDSRQSLSSWGQSFNNSYHKEQRPPAHHQIIHVLQTLQLNSLKCHIIFRRSRLPHWLSGLLIVSTSAIQSRRLLHEATGRQTHSPFVQLIACSQTQSSELSRWRRVQRYHLLHCGCGAKCLFTQ